MKRSGSADLPLHGGRVPKWLGERMTRLASVIVESLVCQYGKQEVLRRLSDPFWFQAFGCVMGMDWHSSGITTSVTGALKRAINPRSRELGLFVCGGRGRHARKTPDELRDIGERTGLPAEELVQTSRLTARVDNNAVQDGFQIYLHAFILSNDGEWTVVQQGMNPACRMARRYHWHSAHLTSFVEQPHTAILGQNQGTILNLTDQQAEAARTTITQLLGERPDILLREARRLVLPARHSVQPIDMNLKRLGAVLAVAYDREIRNFSDALLVEGLGPRTLQSLALVSEVIHGTPVRFSDPARFSFAHGGKDGSPFPVPTHIYDETIDVLRHGLEQAKLGRTEQTEAIRRLHSLAKITEQQCTPEADFHRLISREQRNSAKWGGRTAGDSRGKSAGNATKTGTPSPRNRPQQLTFDFGEPE